MSENEFLNALKEEMPEDFGRELLAQLKAEEQQKVKPFPAFWTVAAASIVTVLVGLVLFMSRMPNAAPLSMMQELWQAREPISPNNINLLEPLLTLGNGHATAIALSPDDTTLAVATGIGIYLHDAHDLEAAPRFLGMPEGSRLDSRAYSEGFSYLEYTADGRLFAFYRDYYALKLFVWDETTQSYQELFSSNQSWLTIQGVDISPDGSKLFYGACNTSTTYFGTCESNYSPRFTMIDLATGESLYFDAPHGVSNAIGTMSPDWTMIAFQEDDEIRLRNIETGETETLLAVDNEQIRTGFVWNETHRLYFSPDGQQIGIRGTIGAGMGWWSIDELRNRDELLHVGPFGSTAAFHGADVVALNPLSDDYVLSNVGGLRINDYADEGLERILASRTQAIQLIVSADGTLIYGLDNTGLIRVWNWANLSEQTASLRYALNTADEFAFNADGTVFTANRNNYSPNNSIGFVWDISGTSVESEPLAANLSSEFSRSSRVALSHDGRYAAYVQDAEIMLYDRELQQSHRLAYVSSRYAAMPVVALSFRADGALIMLKYEGSFGEIVTFTPEMLASGELISPVNDESLPSIPDLRSDERIEFLFSPDGSKLVSFYCPRNEYVYFCQERYVLRVFDTTTWEEIAHVEVPLEEASEGSYFFMLFSKDSRWLGLNYCNQLNEDATFGCETDSKVIRLWNIQQMATTSTMLIEHLPVDVWAYELYPYADGSFLLFGVQQTGTNWQEPSTIFWQVQADGSSQELRRMPFNALNIAPDGSYILSSENGQIQLWGVPANVASGN